MDNWIIEQTAEGASLCIILGDISTKRLQQTLSSYPNGVLCINQSGSNPHSQISTNYFFTTLSDPENPSPDFMEFLVNFIAKDYNKLPDLKSSSHSDHWITKTLELLMLQFDSTIRARKTRNEDGLMRQTNVFTNLHHYLTARIPDKWENFGSGKLCIVTGAGPSLDTTLPIIREWKIPYTIIATDSSIQALYNSNLEPDFILSIDPAKNIESCTKEKKRHGILVGNNTTHPSWIENWEGRTALLSGPVLCEDWLEQKGLFPKSKVNAINNVGLTAIALANYLGFEVTILLGMDLGTDKTSAHSRYAEITDRPQGAITYGMKSYKIPGNFSNHVETTFLSDWKDTSNFCKDISQQRQIINLNDRGAQIEGCLVIHSDKAAELEETLSTFIHDSLDTESMLGDLNHGQKLDEIFTQLASACDRSWRHIHEMEKNPSLQSKFICLRNLMTDPDFPTIMGDYSFAIMPVLLSKEPPRESQLSEFIENIRILLWKLEDSIINLPVNSSLLQKFLIGSF